MTNRESFWNGFDCGLIVIAILVLIAFICSGCAHSERRLIAQSLPMTEDCKRFDVNDDGEVNAGDILVIRGGECWGKSVLPPTPIPRRLLTKQIVLESGKTYADFILTVPQGIDAIVSRGLVRDVTIERFEIAGGRHGVLLGFQRHERITIRDGDIHECSDKGLMIGGVGLRVSRVNVYDCGSHTVRLWWARDSIFEDVYFGPPKSGGKAALKFHAAQAYKDGGAFDGGWVPGESRDNEFIRCSFHGSAPWAVTVGPQDGEHFEVVRGTLFDRCEFKVYDAVQLQLRISGPDTTVRSCTFDMGGRPSWTAAIGVERWGIGPEPTGARIEGCTASGGRLTRSDKLWTDTEIAQ